MHMYWSERWLCSVFRCELLWRCRRNFLRRISRWIQVLKERIHSRFFAFVHKRLAFELLHKSTHKNTHALKNCLRCTGAHTYSALVSFQQRRFNVACHLNTISKACHCSLSHTRSAFFLFCFRPISLVRLPPFPRSLLLNSTKTFGVYKNNFFNNNKKSTHSHTLCE